MKNTVLVFDGGGKKRITRDIKIINGVPYVKYNGAIYEIIDVGGNYPAIIDGYSVINNGVAITNFSELKRW